MNRQTPVKTVPDCHAMYVVGKNDILNVVQMLSREMMSWQFCV